jgi:anti-sigma regulatory factor (Ser/Thr protein kinase)
VRSTIRLPRDLDQVTEFRHGLDRDLDAFGIGAHDRADVGLVVSEVCTNVVSHLVPGDQFDVEVAADASECVIDVHDTRNHQTPATRPNVLAEAGHGLRIVSALAARVETRADDNRPGLVRRVAVTFAEPGSLSGPPVNGATTGEIGYVGSVGWDGSGEVDFGGR